MLAFDPAAPAYVRGQAIRPSFRALYPGQPKTPRSVRQLRQIACPGGRTCDGAAARRAAYRAPEYSLDVPFRPFAPGNTHASLVRSIPPGRRLQALCTSRTHDLELPDRYRQAPAQKCAIRVTSALLGSPRSRDLRISASVRIMISGALSDQGARAFEPDHRPRPKASRRGPRDLRTFPARKCTRCTQPGTGALPSAPACG